MFKIENGVEVRDKVTGFSGVVTGRADYITGCNQYLVQPPAKDGAFVEPRWYDEHRLAVIGTTRVELANDSGKDGADAPAPVK
jgi:hypothetical protein